MLSIRYLDEVSELTWHASTKYINHKDERHWSANYRYSKRLVRYQSKVTFL